MRNRHWPLLIAAAYLVACDRSDSACEQTSAEVRTILEHCGVKFHDYPEGLGSPCTEELRGIYSCYLGCYQDASCEAILLEDEAGFEAFHDCREACLPDD